MKIYNLPVAKTDNVKLKSNSNNPSFKSLSPVAQKQLKTAISSNTSKELFVKLAGIAGLAGLVAWVKTLTNSSNVGVSDKLNKLDFNWSQKGNGLFLDPKTQGEYLNLVSESDSAESLMWAKGMISKDLEPVETREQTPEEIEMFLSPESNDTYLSVSANKTINSLVSQLNALLNAPEDVKTTALKGIDTRLNALVQTANELQNAEESSAIYSKVANILKMFTISNLIKKDVVHEQASLAQTVLEVVSENTNEVSLEESVGETKVSDGLPKSGKIDVDSIDPSGAKKRAKHVRKNNIQTSSASFIEKSSKQSQVTAPIAITDSNRAFVSGVFLPIFQQDPAAVNPEIYSSHIDLIQKIYENYSNESVKQAFLNLLKFTDNTQLLDLYSKIADVNDDKIQFVNFAKLEKIKNESNLSLTKEDYDTLHKYYGSKVKYTEIFIDTPERYEKSQTKKNIIKINFMDGVPTKERLDIISKFHKVIFSIPDDKAIKGEPVDKVELVDIKTELASKLSQFFKAEKTRQAGIKTYLPGNYQNILSFLRLDIDDLRLDYEREGKLGLVNALDEDLVDNSYKNELIELLNNEKFTDFIVTTHARMRFLDRFVLEDDNWKGKTNKTLKAITTRAVNTLEKSLNSTPYLQFINYSTYKSDDAKYGARVNFHNDTVIGLDENGYIHTMF